MKKEQELNEINKLVMRVVIKGVSEPLLIFN
jgi:hypothetical protein